MMKKDQNDCVFHYIQAKNEFIIEICDRKKKREFIYFGDQCTGSKLELADFLMEISTTWKELDEGTRSYKN